MEAFGIQITPEEATTSEGVHRRMRLKVKTTSVEGSVDGNLEEEEGDKLLPCLSSDCL